MTPNPSNQESERKKIENLKQKIRELDAAATKGPWDNEGHTWIYAKVPNGRPNGEGIATFRGERHHGLTPEDDTANAAFTAFARQALPALLAYCEELEGKVNWQSIQTAPQEPTSVLLRTEHNYITIGYRDRNGRHKCHTIGEPTFPFTHWMPLPSCGHACALTPTNKSSL